MSSNEKLCKEGVFSLTAAFLNGTLPCACNIDGSFNHTTCQEYGGQCSCKTGVEGRDCSRCKPGYYNLTAEGCQPCSCKGPNRVCHPQTGMCECPANTIGRTCEPCQCNGNSNKCSRNGDCSDCQHNTTGLRCERCVNMTYGDALTQQCRACDCNSTGSVGSYCDIVTGQCICKSKVSGRGCDTCQNNTFDFGSSGCKDCGCNIYGSASQQCNVSGHCQCKTGAGGMKCSKCTTGYYGLPAKACQACNCNATGTINGTVCNSDAIGQCQCKQGVTGRTCDRCDKYFSNFTDQGCSACPACVMELTKLVNKIAAQANVTTDKGELLEKLARFHAPLADAELLEGRSTMKFDAFLERLKVAGVTYENLIMTNLPHLNVSYNKVYDENAGAMQRATSVSREVASDLNRTKDIHMRTKEAESDIKELDSLLKNIMATFAAQVQYGQQAIRSANESVTDHMMRDFSSQQAIVDMNTRDADNLTSFVAMFAKQVLNQTSLASRLNSEIQQNRRNLSQLVNEWTATHDNFLDLIAQIQHQFSGVRDVIKDTQTILAKEALRLQEAKNVGNESDHILNMTKNDLKLALEKLESYKATVTAVSGEIQISMLKYKDEGNWFALKVLAARNLSPRDLPSGSADPYVLISFIPNEHGTKRSTTKKGTLNPKWGSFEQIFEFNITHEQLKKSKLKVRVLDEDPEDADDFMGEAIIDLSVVGDAEFTKWYPLSSADVSTLESGDFKATSGLADASSLLQSQKNKMMAILGTVDIRLRLAHQNAQLMKNQAEAIQREFSTVQGHGETAVQAIHQFNEIERLINNSMDTLSRANNIIASLALQMNRMPASALLDMARQAKTLASNFLNDVIKRNLSENGVAHVEEYLTRLNDSLKDIIPIWAQTYVHYPDLIKAGNRLKLAAEDAPSAYNAIKSAQEKCRAYEQFVAQAANEVNGIEREVNSLQEKIAFIQSSSQRDMSLIQDAYLHVNNASENMNKSQASVQEVTRIDQVISAQRENISSTLNNVEKRLNDLKRRLSQLDIGLKIDGMGTATYRFPFEWTKSHSEISVIVRTNSSEGQLLNMSSSTTSSQRSQVFTTLSLKNGFVRATFNVGKGDINLINTLRVNDGQWHQIDFTRHGSMGTLTIESPTQWRTVTHNSNDLESTMQFQQGDVVVVGQGNSNPYEVVFSNLKIDQYPILFWDYQSISGTVGVAQPRYPNIYLPDNGLAATFDSARIWSQDIELLSNYLEVEFSFRTFEENGVLMSTFYNDVAELLLYLKNGYLFVEMKNGSDVDVIQSKRSNYNSGIWYGLAFVHDENGNLLNITQSNAVVDTITNTTALTGNRLHATDITIGSISPNISMNGLKETATFIGDMKDFKLSTERAKSLQQVSFKQSSHIDGVYTNEVIAGNVEPGAARFYGFTKGTNKCSYVSVNNTKSSATSLSFMFKTLKKNELLLYSKTMIRNKTVILYIALWHGNLQILNHESNGSNEEAKPYMTSGISFADNIWREVYINSSAKGYSLYVNNSLIYSGWFGNGRQIPFDLSNPLYMGGLPPNVTIPLKPVVTNCFQGAMKNVKIDDMIINLFSQDKENVINGGVLPGRSPPPPPPTCAARAGPIAYSTDKSAVGFVSGFTGESQGYLQISNGVQLEDYFLWTLRLRPLSYNGLVFYIANNLTHPGQFMSLELIDGKLKFQVNGNPGMVHMTTKFDYVNTQRTSSFLTISGLYVSKGKFGAMLIYETQEYHNYQIKNATNGEILNLTGAFFFGGVPNGVKLHPRVTQRSGFSGCIHSFQYHSSGSLPRTIDLSKPSVSHKTQSCVSNAVAGFGLNNTSWAKFGNVSLNISTMDIQMEFRTSSRQGVVFHLTNNNARQGHQSYLRLEQINGQLVMTYKNASAFTRKVTWSASSSYFLCNMTWHTVQVKGAGNKLQLTVDQSSSVTLTVAMDAKLMGDLYVGGMPASISSPPTGFTGCIKGIKISNKILDYGRATSGMHVTNGCASTGTAQKSNDVLAR